MTTAVEAPAPSISVADKLRLIIQPILVVIVAAAVIFWAFSRDLTATQKVRRSAVTAQFEDLIDQLYATDRSRA